MSEVLLDFRASQFRKKVDDSVKKSFKFLYESRRGFLCSLCDASAQRFYDTNLKEIIISRSFCKGMVENTLNYYLFAYTQFMKISRLYTNMLVKCNMKGRYYPNKFVKHDAKFYRHEEIVMEL